MDNIYKPKDAVICAKVQEMTVNENRSTGEDCFSDHEREVTQEEEEEYNCETFKDSLSSCHGESPSVKDDKTGRISRAPKKVLKKQPLENSPRAPRSSDPLEAKKLQSKAYKGSKNTQKKSPKPYGGTSEASPKSQDKKSNNMGVLSKPSSELTDDNKFNGMKVPSKPLSESSEGSEDKTTKESKVIDVLDEATCVSQSTCADDETADTERNGSGKDNLNQKVMIMESRIEKLEQELTEMASLELSLYSVVAEHGCSRHKVHTPARRLSRLYFHAYKNWTQNKRDSISRNTISGLTLIAKSCGNDVSRLTFWLSNTCVLREIISQTFGNLHHLSLDGRNLKDSGNGKQNRGKNYLQKQNESTGNNVVRKLGLGQVLNDWKETSTFTDALQKIESWMFSLIIESLWWQTLIPRMQSPDENSYTVKNSPRLMGLALGDQRQGSFFINLWTSAFMDAYRKICPARAAGHVCGCLPVIARMAMEQCAERLDVAIFNAIIRESANEIPTDPISDPINDSKVLPIPAHDLSFGSGAQLKNAIGNLSRWLTDLLGTDADDSLNDQIDGEADHRDEQKPKSKYFHHLNALSDLLMLPKDMLMDHSIRKEVCPSLSLPLIIRILCNFTPDEFCPDSVPDSVLEALNSESILLRQKWDGDNATISFPVGASSIIYNPPSLAASLAAGSVADTGEEGQQGRNMCLQQKEYNSDEDLDDLESPFTSIVNKMKPNFPGANGMDKEPTHHCGTNAMRYELLRKVWNT